MIYDLFRARWNPFAIFDDFINRNENILKRGRERKGEEKKRETLRNSGSRSTLRFRRNIIHVTFEDYLKSQIKSAMRKIASAAVNSSHRVSGEGEIRRRSLYWCLRTIRSLFPVERRRTSAVVEQTRVRHRHVRNFPASSDLTSPSLIERVNYLPLCVFWPGQCNNGLQRISLGILSYDISHDRNDELLAEPRRRRRVWSTLYIIPQRYGLCETNELHCIYPRHE